ncbi:MAG: hypothetical protein ACKO0Z_07620 [Betaproteobacteria bacterium]
MDTLFFQDDAAPDYLACSKLMGTAAQYQALVKKALSVSAAMAVHDCNNRPSVVEYAIAMVGVYEALEKEGTLTHEMEVKRKQYEFICCGA